MQTTTDEEDRSMNVSTRRVASVLTAIVLSVMALSVWLVVLVFNGPFTSTRMACHARP